MMRLIQLIKRLARQALPSAAHGCQHRVLKRPDVPVRDALIPGRADSAQPAGASPGSSERPLPP
jgi:hypothetical protein